MGCGTRGTERLRCEGCGMRKAKTLGEIRWLVETEWGRKKVLTTQGSFLAKAKQRG